MRLLMCMSSLLVLAACSKPATLPERLYVTDERGNALVEIDPATNEVSQHIAVGTRPRGLLASADGTKLFVAISGSPIAGPGVDEDKLPPADHRKDGIAIVDRATGKVDRILDAGTDPETFALSPDGRILFVSNEDKGEVSAVSIDGGRATLSAKVGEEPEGIAVTPDGAHLFVACEASDHVALLDARTLKPIANIPLPGRPRTLLTARKGDVIYVAVESAGQIALLSAADGSILKRIDIAQGDATIKPMGMVERANGHLFVTTGRAGLLLEIDPAAGTVVRRIEKIGARPWGIALSPDEVTIATANGSSGDVTLLPATGGPMRQIKAGEGPWGALFVSGSRQP